MNVWVKKTRKSVTCFYCGKIIFVGEYQVVCQYSINLKQSSKVWLKRLHFHAKDPSCWVDRAVAELETRVVVETRGRKLTPMSDDMRTERLKILRRRSSIMQRLRAALDGNNIDRIARLTDLALKCADDIEQYGGAPKAWGKGNHVAVETARHNVDEEGK